MLSEVKHLGNEFRSLPVFAEVSPVGIYAANQVGFLFPQPPFDGFLSGDGRVDVTEHFEVQQPVDVVSFCESFDELGFVLLDSLFEIVGQADIKSPGFVGHYVDVVLVGHWHHQDCKRNLLRWPDPSLALRMTVVTLLPQSDKSTKSGSAAILGTIIKFFAFDKAQADTTSSRIDLT